MFALPAEENKAAGTDAVSCVALLNVVVKAVPFQTTVAVLVKLVPVAMSENEGLPAIAAVGLMLVSVGAATTVKTAGADTVPAAGATVMFTAAGAAMRGAETSAVRRVALTNAVVSWVPF